MPANRGKAFIGLVVGGVVLGVTGALARDGLSAAEVRVFRRFNSQTAPSFAVVWVPMQYGTLGAVPALAVAAIARRRPRVAVALGASGAAAWVLAKAVKPMVGRGRPATLLPDVRRRGRGERQGLRLSFRACRRLRRPDRGGLAVQCLGMADRIGGHGGVRAGRPSLHRGPPSPRRAGRKCPGIVCRVRCEARARRQSRRRSDAIAVIPAIGVLRRVRPRVAPALRRPHGRERPCA